MAEGRPDRGLLLADAARMTAIAAGDSAGFEALMRAEAPRLVSLSASLLASQAEAEEVAQETLLRLWQHAPSWQPNARISTWLYRVAYRLSIDRLRRRRPTVPVADIEDMLSDEAASPEDALWEQQRSSLIDAALGRLPPRQRAAVILAHGEGLSQAEAADVLGISEDAYESLLARGRRMLKKLVAAAEIAPTQQGRPDDDRQDG